MIDLTMSCTQCDLEYKGKAKTLVAGSQEYVRMIFQMCLDWLTVGDVVANFRRTSDGGLYSVEVVDGWCYVPHEVIEQPGFSVGLVGTGADGTRIVSRVVAFSVDYGEAVPGAGSTPTKTVYEEILRISAEMKSDAEAAAAEMNATVEEIKDIVEKQSVSTVVATEKAERQAEDAAIRAQVANIIASASETGDNAELIDIRTGYDGTVYTSAGDSVRGQANQLSSDMAHLEADYVGTNGETIQKTSANLFDSESCVDGKYLGGDGITEKDGSIYSHTDFIDVTGFDKIQSFSGFTPSNAVFFYDSAYGFMESNAAASYIGNDIPEGAKFMRFNLGTASKPTACVTLSKLMRKIDYEQVSGLSRTETVRVGTAREYTTIKAAVDYAATVATEFNRVEIVIDAGEYDTLEGFDLSSQTSSFTGLVLPDYVNLVGAGGMSDVILQASLHADASYEFARNNVSTLNLWKNNSLRNMTVKAKNIRYAVHNDDYKVHAVEDAVEEFTNCHFVYEALDDGVDYTTLSKVPFGTGAANGRKMFFDHCVFETLETESKFASLFHNNTEQSKPVEIAFECCKFVGGWGGSVKVSSAGSGQADTLTFKGCKGDKIMFCKESVFTGTNPEFRLYGYGNSFAGYLYEGVTESENGAETEMML